jgi:hypothetical protein
MRSAMRPVIDFLNKLDAEKENPEDDRPLTAALSSAQSQPLRLIARPQLFASPTPRRGPKPPRTTSIQFSRLLSQVEALKEALDCSSNGELGGYLFDTAYEEYVEE